MANSESLFTEVRVCQDTFFILEKKLKKSKKIFFTFQNLQCAGAKIESSKTKEVGNVRATERRQALLELICERRQEKIDNLAFELNVSKTTIYRDVMELSLSYPIYTVAGSHNGGVFVDDDYYLGKQYLSTEQQELLEAMLGKCDANQKKTMLAIIKKFGRKSKK